jgi:hypothetical protein
MSASGINLEVRLGMVIPMPAPLHVMEALDTVEVTHSDSQPSVLQIQFRADRSASSPEEFALLTSGLLDLGGRVMLGVVLDGSSTALFDGFITHHEMVHDRASGAATLSITAEDVSIMMDLIEISVEYPLLGDSAMVEFNLLPFLALGIVPEIIPAESALLSDPLERTTQQNSTTRQFINQLAAPHGYVFYVRPGPILGMNTAYWGPPNRIALPQKALSIDSGPETNVENVSFQYDAMAATNVYGFGVDPDLEDLPYPVLTVMSRRFPPLAMKPALLVNQPFVKKSLFSDPRLGMLAGLDAAQSITDVSTDRVVTATGTVSTLRYGAVLEAPGLVVVRGAGMDHDGLWYVQQVSHHISDGKYSQQFTLTREGLGSTIPGVI